MKKLVAIAMVGLMASTASAAVVGTTTDTAVKEGLNYLMSSSDLIQGKIATELAGDNGWHSANTAYADQLPAFTDGIGFVGGSGLTGLLNDFPPADGANKAPTKLVQYDLDAASDIGEINIFSTNNEDGRVFSTTVVRYSTDGGANFSDLGYFQSHASGTINSAGHAQSIGIKSAMVSITDDQSDTLLAGVTNLQFYFYASNNSAGQANDPFEGVNPYTGVDDLIGAVHNIQSPLIHEIDVIEVPEPGTMALLALGGLALIRRR